MNDANEKDQVNRVRLRFELTGVVDARRRRA